MQILAHRGYWKDKSEKNSKEAILRAFQEGYGIETDIRDFHGEIVISHNIVTDSNVVSFENILKIYHEQNYKNQLAINIKADGLQSLLKPLLQKYCVTDYFCFDMSIPELVVNEREQLTFYTRHSDIETECVMYEKAAGVWLDSFYTQNWLTEEIIVKHLNNGKRCAIISPEIHGFDQSAMWKMLKENRFNENPDIALCTDLPRQAKEFFYE